MQAYVQAPAASIPPSAGTPVVALRGLTKRFPGVVANDNITIEVHSGEVHVLLGENGAGKSTLVGMLSGLQQPDEGRIEIDGESVAVASPRQALAHGDRNGFPALHAGSQPDGRR